MGEISEMILDGTLDQYTGEYLGDAVGYPRSREFHKHTFTIEDNVNGVIYYCSNVLKLTKKQRRELLLSFYPVKDSIPVLSNNTICLHASKNWKEFKKFANNWEKQNKAI